MSVTIPESHLDLLTTKPAFAQLATTMKDGTPQVTPIWIGWDGTHIIINTAKGRVKAKNLDARPDVAMAILDPENPYRYLGVRGKVVGSDEEGADESIDALAKKYMGVDSYPFRTPTETRIIYKVVPTSVHTAG
jgi:PPOX class probable F420-dependent enzyme